MSNEFHSLIDFLQVDWNGMFTVLVLLLSQTLKFLYHGTLIGQYLISWYTSNYSNDWSLTRNSILRLRDNLSFYYRKIHSSVWIFFEDACRMLAWSNYCRLYFHIAEIIVNFANFCHFAKFYAHQMKALV